MDYKDTLSMPKTDFPMRGNLGVRELEFQKSLGRYGFIQKSIR